MTEGVSRMPPGRATVTPVIPSAYQYNPGGPEVSWIPPQAYVFLMFRCCSVFSFALSCFLLYFCNSLTGVQTVHVRPGHGRARRTCRLHPPISMLTAAAAAAATAVKEHTPVAWSVSAWRGRGPRKCKTFDSTLCYFLYAAISVL